MGGNKLQIRPRSHTHKEGGKKKKREGEGIMNEKKEGKNKDK